MLVRLAGVMLAIEISEGPGGGDPGGTQVSVVRFCTYMLQFAAYCCKRQMRSKAEGLEH